MNVLELADELEQWYSTDAPRKAATMLRKLQGEITVSENLIRHLHSENKELRDENSKLQAENEALKKQLEACALLNYNKGHEDGRKLVVPSPAKNDVLFTEYNEAVSRELWLDLGKASEK